MSAAACIIFQASPERKQLVELYQRFVHKVIAPMFSTETAAPNCADFVGKPEEEKGTLGAVRSEGTRTITCSSNGIVFQSEPVLRCSFPSDHPHSRPHVDADYYHQVFAYIS